MIFGVARRLTGRIVAEVTRDAHRAIRPEWFCTETIREELHQYASDQLMYSRGMAG